MIKHSFKALKKRWWKADALARRRGVPVRVATPRGGRGGGWGSRFW